MSTQYTVEWLRGRGRNSDRIVLHLPRYTEEDEALALARGLTTTRKDVKLWKEEDVTQVTRIELEEVTREQT